MKKYSVIGMALVAAAAVVSAFTPSTASTAQEVKNLPGTLIESEEGGDLTCTAGVDVLECDYSVTQGGGGTSNTNAQTAQSTNDATDTDTNTTEF